MKSLMKLHECLLQDLSRLCCVSTQRDLQTIALRTKNEGMSFLTITLPTFSKAFERGLEKGSVDPTDFPGFHPRKSGRLPAFLQGFVSRVFDPWSGVLLEHPCPHSIFAVRQICLAYKKYKAACSPKRERKAFEDFVLVDHEVEMHSRTISEHQLEGFVRASRTLFGPILSGLEEELDDPDFIVPRHGPGATADRIVANAKYDRLVWTKRLQQYFPFAKFLLTERDTRLSEVPTWSPRDEIPVRVISVPKTLKTPRIIAVEPTAMQYVQQGILEKLVPLLESYSMYDSLGFTDQGPNKELARRSSIDQAFATLDLSEASDRVSNLLVQHLLTPFPRLQKRVDACRSRYADVPGHGVLHLAKFASMGSALCFPIEAMVFLTICFIAYTKAKGSANFGDRKAFLKSVRIYGDDIIVPTDMAHAVSSELSDFGLKVNQHKSFWNGKFRESCGGDYYSGYDVKPRYIKSDIPRKLTDVEEMVSTVALRNLLYKEGLWITTAYLDQQLEKIAPFPIVGDESPTLGRHSFLEACAERISDDLHRPEVRGMVLVQKPRSSPLSGEGALMKFFLKRGIMPYFAKDHLQHSGRPQSAYIKLRWSSMI